ncbi:cofilin [Entomortierella chlamydospora]|uniref:Cofilin n=1 Tax=Entomortierella chlamydospora TaxID=101097 RepID=A0A9P6MYE3_9FUNG|nr:cofilin [Entomortierella chlamydospora]
MSSAKGVQVTPDCVNAFQELKLAKKIKYIIYKISNDGKSIIVETKSKVTTYDEFLKHLPKSDCRWAVYDFDYKTSGGDRNKIVFYTWLPEAAATKSRMLYTSSKNALRKSLTGVGIEIQGTDYAEVSYSTVLKSVARG